MQRGRNQPPKRPGFSKASISQSHDPEISICDGLQSIIRATRTRGAHVPIKLRSTTALEQTAVQCALHRKRAIFLPCLNSTIAGLADRVLAAFLGLQEHWTGYRSA